MIRRATRTVVLLLVGWPCLAPPAGAATHRVRDDHELHHANENARPGDLVRIAPGRYRTPIAPMRSGQRGRPIRYVGDRARPASVRVPRLSLNRDHVTVAGVQLDGGFSIGGAADSLVDFIADAPEAHLDADGMVDGVIARGTLRAQTFWCATDDSRRGRRNRFSDLRATLVNRTDDRNTIKLSRLRDSRFTRCSWDITVQARGGSPQKMFTCQDNVFENCTWDATIVRTRDLDEAGWWALRDSSRNNRFTGCTVRLAGPGSAVALLSQSGTFPGTNGGNRWEGCRFYQSAPLASEGWGAVAFQDGMDGSALVRCVIATDQGTALWVQGRRGLNRVESCTIYGSTEHDRAVVRFEDCKAWEPGTVIRFRNNIVQSSGPFGGGHAVAIGYTLSQHVELDADHNLYWHPGNKGRQVFYDRWLVGGGECRSPDQGFSGVGRRANPCELWGADCNSIVADPKLARRDIARFDATPLAGSPALRSKAKGGPLGAVVPRGRR